MLVTALVLHELMFLLKVVAPWNIPFIEVTWETSQPVMSGFAVVLENAKDRSLTVLGSAGATLRELDAP
jgi:acyl-CoA reductase-like NAD-dependent aldehyde dehydrogenase